MKMLLIYILKHWKEHLSSMVKGSCQENSVRAFYGGDEYVASKDPVLRRYPSIPNK
jgi:hypothetical protein